MTAQQTKAARRKARIDPRYTGTKRKDARVRAQKYAQRVAAENARKQRKKNK